jgi:hypothetical protein
VPRLATVQVFTFHNFAAKLETVAVFSLWEHVNHPLLTQRIPLQPTIETIAVGLALRFRARFTVGVFFFAHGSLFRFSHVVM